MIAMTAETGSGARDERLSTGMDDYIAKPVTLQDLLGRSRNGSRRGAGIMSTLEAVRLCDEVD
jgi:DNA-binding response OmpR family regulator